MSVKSVIYFCNGKYLPSSKASLNANDLGVVRGFGLFDSVRVYNLKPFLLKQHLDRLFRAIQAAGIKPPASKAAFANIISRLIKKNRLPNAIIKIIVTGGLSQNLLAQKKSSLLIMIDPFHPLPEWKYTKGIAVMTTPAGRIFPEIKTTNYFAAVRASIQANRKGFAEAVYVDKDGAILEGTTFSVCAILPGPRLVTAKEAVLPGITEQCVMQLARKLKIPVIRKPISPSMLRQAKELFLTSSVREVLPIVRVDQRRIGNGKPGPVTQKLHREFKYFVACSGGL